MKCDNCGNDKFYKVDIIDDQCTEGHVYQRVEAVACDKCGLIKLFVSGHALQQHNEQLKNEVQQQQQERKRLEQEKQVLESKIKNLQTIIDDKNQTVKAVRQAKEEQELLQNKLRGLRG